MNSSGRDISPRPLAGEFSTAPGENPAASSANRRAAKALGRVPVVAPAAPAGGGARAAGAGPLR
jgi:hypothetical protein